MAWFCRAVPALMVSAWPEVVWSSIATAVLVEVSVPDCVPVAVELSLVLFEPECPLAVVLSLLEPEIVVVPLPFVVSVPVSGWRWPRRSHRGSSCSTRVRWWST